MKEKFLPEAGQNVSLKRRKEYECFEVENLQK